MSLGAYYLLRTGFEYIRPFETSIQDVTDVV